MNDHSFHHKKNLHKNAMNSRDEDILKMFRKIILWWEFDTSFL